MRRATGVMPLMLASVALGACKDEARGHATAAAPGVVAAPAAMAAVSDAAAAAGCDLAGDYRVRFRANGHDGWWLRFTVAGTPPQAEVQGAVTLLGLRAGAVETRVDPTTCALTLRNQSAAAGDVELAMTVAASGAVTGQLTRSKPGVAGESPSPLVGWRGDGGPADRACIVPGVYELTVDERHPWKNMAPGDRRSCKDVADRAGSLYLRVEWLGDQLVIDHVTLDDDDQWAGTLADETVALDGCAATIDVRGTESLELAGTLTFAAAGVTGVASRATFKIVEETDVAEDLWDCASTRLPLTARLVPPASPRSVR